jgi:hypothetical protein
MAKVKIQGHASGTGILTVTAPNTSTDRTITLPDSTGTLLDSTSTLDATKVSGTHASFASTGIDDNADATAITINSSENVGIGTASPVDKLEVVGAIVSSGGLVSHQTSKGVFQHSGNDTTFRSYGSSAGTGRMLFNTGGGGGSTDTLRLELTADGRGLSQFTAKAWVNFRGFDTVTVNDSHNVSSVTDNGTGNYSINFSNNMANTNYSLTSMSKAYSQYGNYSDSLGTLAVGSVVIEHREGAAYNDVSKFCGTVFGD